jgi:hypothetical protein
VNPDTAVAAAVIGTTALLVVTAITAGLIADHQIEDHMRHPLCDCEAEPLDLAEQAYGEDGYALPVASVVRHSAHARPRHHSAVRLVSAQRDRGAA